MTNRMELPPFIIERIPETGLHVCELIMCYPAAPATHRVLYGDGGTVLICDRHAIGLVALGEYLAHGPVSLELL